MYQLAPLTFPNFLECADMQHSNYAATLPIKGYTRLEHLCTRNIPQRQSPGQRCACRGSGRSLIQEWEIATLMTTDGAPLRALRAKLSDFATEGPLRIGLYSGGPYRGLSDLKKEVGRILRRCRRALRESPGPFRGERLNDAADRRFGCGRM